MAVSDFRITCEIAPRFRDTDAMGHVNNAVYVTYFEIARQEYWQRVQGHSDYKRVPFILAHVTLDFRSELLVREVAVVGIRCDHIGGKSFSFVYEVWEKESGRLIAEGRTVQVCYDYSVKGTIAMPPDLRRTIEALEGRTFPVPSEVQS